MKFFSEEDINDVHRIAGERDNENNRINDDKAFKEKIRNQLIEDVLHGFDVFMEVAKEYPQIAKIKNQSMEHISAYNGYFLGMEFHKTYKLYHLGLWVEYKATGPSGPCHNSKLYVDETGKLFCSWSEFKYLRNYKDKEYYVHEYCRADLRRFLESDLRLGVGNMINVGLPSIFITFTYGDSVVKVNDYGNEGKSYYINIEPISRMSDEEIARNIVEFLKKS